MTHRQTCIFLIVSHLLFALISHDSLLHAKTFSVNSNASASDALLGDGLCATLSGSCTLKAAIQEANRDGESSTIIFAAQFRDINSIDGCSSLPALKEDYTFIDASSQWDHPYNRPGVEIKDSACNLLTIDSSNNTIVGLQFGGGSTTGILVQSGNQNRIGGYNAGQRNVFLTGDTGVLVQSSGSTTYIQNNLFGTIDGENLSGPSGTYGVFVQTGSASNTIISDNIITGQSDSGIFLWSGGNYVSGNTIGLSQTRSVALPNKIGITLYGSMNVVEGVNYIAGNTSHGLCLYHSDDNSIFNNRIGNPGSGLNNGGDGIHVHVSDNAEIGKAGLGNIIEGNNGNGIYVNISSDISILSNTITQNGVDGIHLNNSSGDIGSTASGDKNEIGANSDDGIEINASTNINVFGNYIGLTSGVFDAGNLQHGIVINNGSDFISVGGEQTGQRNWIAWNKKDGITIHGSSTRDNSILNNIIGAPVNWAWQAPNGNHGISIYDGANNNNIGGG